MKAAVAVVGILLSSFSLAAPPADPKFVDAWSRMDEFHAARGVRKAAVARELKRAPVPELERLVDAFLDAHPNTGLLVLKGDTILAERYQYGRTAQHRLASASVAKTVLGMMVGFAVQEKKLSLEDRADKYVPELKGHPFGETSIRHLLTMSSGIAFHETYDGRDDASKLVANTLHRQTDGGAATVLEFRQREAPAGTRFHYASGNSEVLGLVLIAAVKQPLADYLSEQIWQPMGAEANATWLLDKAGYETGYCCINAVLRDYARFGMLLANYGALDGRQIIPAEWVKAATTPQAPHLRVGTATPNNGYGYQTWILGNKDRHPRVGGDPVGRHPREEGRHPREEGRHPREGGDPVEHRFAAFGIHGQAIYVHPAHKLVVVHTAAWADPADRAARGAQFKLFEAILAKLESQ